MAFGELKIEKSEFYLGKAIRKSEKTEKKAKKGEKKIRIETLDKIRAVKDSVYEDLTRIEKNFPDMDTVDEFYKELIETKIGIKNLKELIGRVNWTKRKIVQLHKDYKNKIVKSKKDERIKKNKNQYYGRIKSLLEKIRKVLEELENARRKIKELPKIKTKIKTACITGFPNVGKSTLLKKLTKAGVEIKPYAFTTKDIMMGYIENEVQVIDTPGTLNRYEKMNSIEKIASIAMKHLGEIIIYVIDPTETSGYTIKQQIELLERIEEEYKKEIVIYVSKKDIAREGQILMIRIMHNKYKVFDDSGKLKEYLVPPRP